MSAAGKFSEYIDDMSGFSEDLFCDIVRKSTEKVLSQTEICTISHLLYSKGFFEGTSGNISRRLSDDRILITPSGKAKNTLIPEDLIITDLNGSVIEGEGKPSSEIKMHLAVYRKRADINAVIHAHPPYSVAYCISEKSLDLSVMAEAAMILENVPVLKYARPSTDEVPEHLDPYLATNNVFLMENHGLLALGRNLKEAQYRAETLEFTAHVNSIVVSMGGGIKHIK